MTQSDAPRGWIEELASALTAADRADGPAIAAAFAHRLPASYFERTTPRAAAADLTELEALARLVSQGGDGAEVVRMAVQPDPDMAAGMFRFRLYGRRGVELSNFLPILESFGLIVVEAVPHRIQSPDSTGPHWHLDDFGLRAPGNWVFDPERDGSRLIEAVQAVWTKDAEMDSLNRLVVCARLSWQDVMVLRAYRRYRRHAGTAWTDEQLDDALATYPSVAQALLAYFAARFDPAAPDASGDKPAQDRASSGARDNVLDELAAVEGLVDDQVLRGYLSLVDATLRTSHYVPDEQGGPWATVTLKLDGRLVPEVPAPRTYVETFVHSTRLEGLHLRAGPVARGGIRWSDRQNDLRTEVLGLMRAQVLKNAGIVPTGAKGGFVCRRLVRDPHGWLPVPRDVEAEVKACYQLFIQSLLDVTDNVVQGKVVNPPGVRPADGEDPYLVVAADRGTAVLSDLADQISLAARFWLGDAFASGGSHGYDHKAIGITARGVWTIVQQHFRQLGMDVQKDRVRVVGVGDMSGDVFGNGMLRSRSMQLVAAFDHRDIFIDPSPDPGSSFDERKRLFSLPRSSWQDYDPSKLSAGGGVWPRTAKEIRLSPEARAALGLGSGRADAGDGSDTFRPPEIVSAILAAPVDLLWMGGIGTFVKAANESNSDVGDRANDTVRITADKLRARVVAEGGNLGLTQRARIAYSRRGGKINTDFIDNAAGVEISDREVNLKILLALAVESGGLTEEGRDSVLTGAENEVVASVLAASQLAAESVSRAVPESAADLDAFDALMGRLEVSGRLDRKVEALPDAEEIGLRRAAGAGLTRPEAAVVYAYAKTDIAEALAGSSLTANPTVRPAVGEYFPASVAARFGELIERHRLYPDLAAIQVTGEIVDRMGITWANELAEEFGTGLQAVATVYWAARTVLHAEKWWENLDRLVGSQSADIEGLLYQSVRSGLDRMARTYMGRPRLDLARTVAEDEPVAATLADSDRDLVTGSVVDALVKGGIEREMAGKFAGFDRLGQAADLAHVIRSVNRSLPDVVAAFDAVDNLLKVGVFESQLASLIPGGRWERWQERRLGDDLARIRRQVVVLALTASPDTDPASAVLAFAESRAEQLARFERLAAQVDGAGGADARSGEALALAALAIRALEDLASA